MVVRFLFLIWFVSIPALAHEVRPASLDVRELESGSVELRWRQPVLGEYTIAIAPILSSGWLDREPDRRIVTENSLIHIWQTNESIENLAGQTLWVRGLDRTITDVLVQVHYADGEIFSRLIKAADPSLEFSEKGIAGASLEEYFSLGLEHIWSGLDHLLYVFALILLIGNLRALIFTITSFTLAHSITLACAALGLVSLQSAPVEAVISLSIVYVAVELVHVKQGRPSLASKAPWIIAFVFGLLHGFGFAGALQEIGLPDQAVAFALLLFNIGIEAGQLLFVFCILLVFWGIKKIKPVFEAQIKKLAPYGIGPVASFWLIERLLIIIQ